MQSASAHELGYASAAVLFGLVDHLLDRGIITRTDALSVFDDAIKSLNSVPNQSMQGAARYLETAIRPNIAQHHRS